MQRQGERLVGERESLASFHEAVKSRIDRESGVIKGVKLMGLESKNSRRYRVPDGKLFEGVPVRLNHHGKENGPEPDHDPPFEGIWGVVRNVQATAEGVVGDIHYNKAHAMVPTILWWAENQSNVGGFSPITWSLRSEQGGETIMDILAVESVDLVDRPATTRGFFEREQETMTEAEIKKLQDDLAASNAKVTTLESDKTALTKRVEDEGKRATEAEGKLATNEAAVKASERKNARLKLIADAKLPEGVATEKFSEAVIRADKDEDAVALIETVKSAAGAPRSTASTPGDAGNGAGAKPKYESYEDAKKAGAFDYKGSV